MNEARDYFEAGTRIMRVFDHTYIPVPRGAKTDGTCFVILEHTDLCTAGAVYVLDPEATTYTFELCAEHMAELRADFTKRGRSYRARSRTIDP